jgi:predicted nucleic acid-binding protein
MTTVFADTSYFVAFFGANDQHHARAMAWTRALGPRVVTTEYVAVEVGNTLTKGANRTVFAEFYEWVRGGEEVELIPASTDLMDRGAKLFAERLDKQWSLTDCISFCVMTERGLTDALSADRDFEQAGFRALLRHEPESMNGSST